MPNLIRHRCVMHVSTQTRIFPTGTIPFDCLDDSNPGKLPDERDDGPNNLLHLDKTLWDEMGQPQTITMTVVPGDTLNEED